MTTIAAVIVGTDGERFRCLDANDERLELAERIAGFTKGAADVVLLPAGFLAAETAAGVKPLATSLAEVFRKQVLLAGIDEVGRIAAGAKGQRSGKARNTMAAGEGYPYWAFASKAGKLIDEPWRQRSARSGEEVSDPALRCVPVGKAKIGLLICGELYNPVLADSLAQAQPDLVVDLAHRSMTRFTKSLHRVATTTGCVVYHVQHVALKGRNASKWKATSRGARCDPGMNWASYKQAGWMDGALWAEVKVWEA